MASEKSRCHPSRKAYRGDRCRECCQVAPRPDDHLPAIIAGTEQHGGPEMPRACPHCHAPWDAVGDYQICFFCGEDWYRTSLRVLRPPRDTRDIEAAARGFRGQGRG